MEAVARPLAVPPSWPDLARGGAGFALLGLAAGAGAPGLAPALLAAPVVVGAAVLPVLVTAPALLVLHQFLGLSAPPEAVVACLVRPWARAGRLAAGLAPVVLFFALTSELWSPSLVLAVLTVGLVGLAGARRALSDLEPRAHTLHALWTLLCAAVGLRIAWLLGVSLWYA